MLNSVLGLRPIGKSSAMRTRKQIRTILVFILVSNFAGCAIEDLLEPRLIPATISVQVRDSNSGIPIENAQVTLSKFDLGEYHAIDLETASLDGTVLFGSDLVGQIDLSEAFPTPSGIFRVAATKRDYQAAEIDNIQPDENEPDPIVQLVLEPK